MNDLMDPETLVAICGAMAQHPSVGAVTFVVGEVTRLGLIAPMSKYAVAQAGVARVCHDSGRIEMWEALTS